MKKIIALLFLFVGYSQGMSWLFKPDTRLPRTEAVSIPALAVGFLYTAGFGLSTYDLIRSWWWTADSHLIDVQKAIEQDKIIAGVFKTRLLYLTDPYHNYQESEFTADLMIRIYKQPTRSFFENEVFKQNRFACEIPEYLKQRYVNQFECINLSGIQKKHKAYSVKIKKLDEFQKTADQVLATIKRI